MYKYIHILYVYIYIYIVKFPSGIHVSLGWFMGFVSVGSWENQWFCCGGSVPRPIDHLRSFLVAPRCLKVHVIRLMKFFDNEKQTKKYEKTKEHKEKWRKMKDLFEKIHPRKLTWIPKMMVWKRQLASKIAIVGIYVRFLECNNNSNNNNNNRIPNHLVVHGS